MTQAKPVHGRPDLLDQQITDVRDRETNAQFEVRRHSNGFIVSDKLRLTRFRFKLGSSFLGLCNCCIGQDKDPDENDRRPKEQATTFFVKRFLCQTDLRGQFNGLFHLAGQNVINLFLPTLSGGSAPMM